MMKCSNCQKYQANMIDWELDSLEKVEAGVCNMAYLATSAGEWCSSHIPTKEHVFYIKRFADEGDYNDRRSLRSNPADYGYRRRGDKRVASDSWLY
jgi:hypothetical protein